MENGVRQTRTANSELTALRDYEIMGAEGVGSHF